VATPRAFSLNERVPVIPHAALFLPHLDVAGGLGVHCRTLLAALASGPSPFRFTVYAPADAKVPFPTVATEPYDGPIPVTRVAVPNALALAHELDPLLAGPLAADPPDVLYCSYYTGMKRPPCPQVVAFHDAGFLENPAGFGAVAAVRRATVESIRESVSMLQCISHDARDRICRLLPWPVAKTAVVWHALPDSDDAIAAAKASDRPGECPGPYFLSPVGAATGFNRARKNVPTAVTAFRRLNRPGVTLVIAGTATLTDAVLGELLPPGERGRVSGERWRSDDGAVTILPTVPRPELLRLMRHATAVVYPSRYEGFGLPAVEAMAVGTPLIAARATSLPELVGDSGVLIEPDDVAGFAEAMRTLLDDRIERRRRTDLGTERVFQFGRGRMGREMSELFESVMTSSRS
jgi:glycosyltransferase involved in cell wall biosynthesis